MIYRKHFFSIPILSLFLLLSGCATSGQHSLSEIPSYNEEAANANWKPIEELHQQYRLINRALAVLVRDMKVEPTEKQLNAMEIQINAYYFHSSAATIELFYGDYPASRVSTGKAETALMTLGKIVRELIEANNV